MKLDIVNIEGKNTGRSVELPENVFGVEPNKHAVYLAIKQYNAAQRQGTHKAKERGEVSRTTKKFKKQKGTGGARAGSLRSPLFKGGGTIFGPRPRNYVITLNKKVKRLARYSVLSEKASSGNLTVIEDFNFEAPKTQKMVEILNNLGIKERTLIVLPDYNDNVYLSGRNIENTSLVNVKDLNTYEILNASRILFFESSINIVQ